MKKNENGIVEMTSELEQANPSSRFGDAAGHDQSSGRVIHITYDDARINKMAGVLMTWLPPTPLRDYEK